MCIWHKFTLLAQHPIVKDYDLSHVKLCASGAAPLSAELTQQFARVFPNCCIGQGYGEYLSSVHKNGPLMVLYKRFNGIVYHDFDDTTFSKDRHRW